MEWKGCEKDKPRIDSLNSFNWSLILPQFEDEPVGHLKFFASLMTTSLSMGSGSAQPCLTRAS